MAYEVVTFLLRDGVPNDSIESVLKEYILDFIVAEPGVQRAYWGVEIENPRKVHMFVHWDSVEAHRELQKKDYYLPFVQKLDEITDLSKIHAFHTHVDPHPADQVLHDKTSPVTEIFTAYFPQDYSDASQNSFVKRLETFLANVQAGATGTTGYSGGWSVEDLPIPGSLDQGKAFMALFGWQSLEAHGDFVKTETFKENRHLIDQVDQLLHREVVHYKGTRFK